MTRQRKKITHCEAGWEVSFEAGQLVVAQVEVLQLHEVGQVPNGTQLVVAQIERLQARQALEALH